MIKYFKALSDFNRLRIVNLLIEAEKLCVCELEVILGMTQSNVSRHLSKLRDSSIVETVKNAQWVYYQIAPEFIEKDHLLFEYLKDASNDEQLFSDVDRYRMFVNKNLTCMDIRERKGEVVDILEK